MTVPLELSATIAQSKWSGDVSIDHRCGLIAANSAEKSCLHEKMHTLMWCFLTLFCSYNSIARYARHVAAACSTTCSAWRNVVCQVHLLWKVSVRLLTSALCALQMQTLFVTNQLKSTISL